MPVPGTSYRVKYVRAHAPTRMYISYERAASLPACAGIDDLTYLGGATTYTRYKIRIYILPKERSNLLMCDYCRYSCSKMMLFWCCCVLVAGCYKLKTHSTVSVCMYVYKKKCLPPFTLSHPLSPSLIWPPSHTTRDACRLWRDGWMGALWWVDVHQYY